MNFGEIDQLMRKEIDDEVGVGQGASRIEPWQSLLYANEAEEEACRRAKLLVDSDIVELCRIAVAVGTAVYAYDPRIISIRRIKLASRTKPLGKFVYWELDERRPGWETRTGIAEAIVTGMESRKIRLDKIPTATDTLILTVARLPLNPMAKAADVPEIPVSYHRSLVLWMKHKVYNNTNSELFDKNRANVHLALFEQEFGTKSSAINEVFDEMNLPYDSYDGHLR